MSRPITPAGAYARKLGITTGQLRSLGGIEKAQKLTEEARNLIISKRKHR